jgi:putative transposase
MNQLLLSYIKFIIIANISRNALNFSKMSKHKVSHDSFSKMLHRDYDWSKTLETLNRIPKSKKGYLLIDDTVIEKPHSSKLEGASWVYSSSHGKCIFGYHLVILAWTDGKKKVIVDQKMYIKGGKSKIDLALDMLSYARNKLKLKPKYVLFDSWYSSKKILRRVSDYGWYFVTRIKKNRKFGSDKLTTYKINPYWIAKDSLNCGLRVLVVRNGKKYFCTNLLSLGKKELLEIYRIRQTIEEINKLLKFCGLNDCQARKIKAYNQHVQCTIIAFTLLEHESRRLGQSIYSLKKGNSLTERYVEKHCFSRLNLAA